MEKPGTARIYPAAPLETSSSSVIGLEQQQPLLKVAPPSYDQATKTSAPAAATTPISPTTTTTATTNENSPTVVIISQPTAGQPYGPHAIDVLCPYCHNYARTKVRHEPSSQTHLIALVLCVLQLYCCVCLPYLIGSCMKANHYCGLCDNYLGTYTRA